jgi:hypothetical protein
MDSVRSADSRSNEELLAPHQELGSGEADSAAGIKPPAACNRSVSARKRLKGLFQRFPGDTEGVWA